MFADESGGNAAGGDSGGTPSAGDDGSGGTPSAGGDDSGGTPSAAGSNLGGSEGQGEAGADNPPSGCDVDESDRCVVGSTFDGDEGWRVIDIEYVAPRGVNYATPVAIYEPSYEPDAGNPGGAISATDPSGGILYFCAPPAFMSDGAAAYGGTLSFDLDLTDAVANYDDADIILASDDAVLLKAPGLSIGPGWNTFLIDLEASTEWHLDSLSGAAPSEAVFRDVLEGLTELCIRGEHYNLGLETVLLDNVYLRAPEL